MVRLLRAGPTGKIRRLIALLRRYGEAIEADLALRGWDLAELWRHRRVRFVLNVIDHLPRNSYFVEAVAQDDELADMTRDEGGSDAKPSMRVAEFGVVEEILAAIRDEIAQLSTNFVAANSTKKHKPKAPKPWPRPETARERAKHRWQMADVMDIVAKATPHAADDVRKALGQPTQTDDVTDE